MTSIEEK